MRQSQRRSRAGSVAATHRTCSCVSTKLGSESVGFHGPGVMATVDIVVDVVGSPRSGSALDARGFSVSASGSSPTATPRATRSASASLLSTSRDHASICSRMYAKAASSASNASLRSGPSPPPSFHMISYTPTSSSSISARSPSKPSHSKSSPRLETLELRRTCPREDSATGSSASSGSGWPVAEPPRWRASKSRAARSDMVRERSLALAALAARSATAEGAPLGEFQRSEADELGRGASRLDRAELELAPRGAHQAGHLALGEVFPVRQEQVQDAVFEVGATSGGGAGRRKRGLPRSRGGVGGGGRLEHEEGEAFAPILERAFSPPGASRWRARR